MRNNYIIEYVVYCSIYKVLVAEDLNEIKRLIIRMIISGMA